VATCNKFRPRLEAVVRAEGAHIEGLDVLNNFCYYLFVFFSLWPIRTRFILCSTLFSAYGIMLLERRRCNIETLCYGDVLFLYTVDVLSRRRFMWRYFACGPLHCLLHKCFNSAIKHAYRSIIEVFCYLCAKSAISFFTSAS
jgi:hypothetical protein